MLTLNVLWMNHPGKEENPCNKALFLNQCAIRMSVSLYLSNIDLSTFYGVKCWGTHTDMYESKLKSLQVKTEDLFYKKPYFLPLKKDAGQFKHFLRAIDIANWMDSHPEIFGTKRKFDRKDDPFMDYKKFTKYKGIIFILDGWGPTDHIDLWNGYKMKGGY